MQPSESRPSLFQPPFVRLEEVHPPLAPTAGWGRVLELGVTSLIITMFFAVLVPALIGY